MDITKRLIELQQRYGWTDYKIAKEAGLSPNTVSNIYRRGNTPSMVTLEAICKAFNITMAQFFAEDEMVELTPELRELFDRWTALTDEQKAQARVNIGAEASGTAESFAGLAAASAETAQKNAGFAAASKNQAADFAASASASQTAAADSAAVAANAAGEAKGYRDEAKEMLDNAEIEPVNTILFPRPLKTLTSPLLRAETQPSSKRCHPCRLSMHTGTWHSLAPLEPARLIWLRLLAMSAVKGALKPISLRCQSCGTSSPQQEGPERKHPFSMAWCDLPA